MISAFPDAEIEIIYGSTEAEPIAAIPAARLAGDQELSALRGGLPAGKINNRIYLKIIKYTPGELSWDTMQEIIHSGIDQPGEIIVSGPHVLAQYFKNEDAFRKNKILDPAGNIWHRTGDAGYLNAAGELFLTGRCERIIYADGKIFSPFMYENKIAEFNGVIAGTLLRTGDKIAFVIEPEQGAVREKIKAEISRFNPANFDIIFIDKMPRDPRHQSKIDYQKLEELRVEN